MYFNEFNRPVRRKIPVQAVKNGAERPDQRPASENNRSTFSPETVRGEVVRSESGQETDWQATAQRLQAEMENFRKRQQRRADEAIAGEKERLLSRFLPIADNMARALNHQGLSERSLHQGVGLIYRELMRLLEAEGVTRLETVGQSFTPELHEAVAAVPAPEEPETIVEEIEPGYMLGDKLLRPARVVVAAA